MALTDSQMIKRVGDILLTKIQVLDERGEQYSEQRARYQSALFGLMELLEEINRREKNH